MVRPPSGNMARKQCFLICSLLGNMGLCLFCLYELLCVCCIDTPLVCVLYPPPQLYMLATALDTDLPTGTSPGPPLIMSSPVTHP